MIMFGDHDQLRGAQGVTPRLIKLTAHPLTYGLQQISHGFARYRHITFNAQNMLLARKADNLFMQGIHILHLGQTYHHRVEVIMLVIVMPIVMRGARR